MKTTWLNRGWTRAHAANLRFAAVLTMVTTGSVFLAGCAADASGAPDAPLPTARVIMRFKPGMADPADPAYLARLATLASIPGIALIRPMSGDAYVMLVTCPASTPGDGFDACDPAISRLRGVSGVLDVERDRREKIR